MIETPIVLFIFRRPDLTRQVFESIRAAQPKHFLIVADGPRNPSEADLCALTRQVLDHIDWPCEVLRNYADVNMGLRARLVSGLSWVFDLFPEAIILEDDCVPHPDFYRFCQEMLERFRDVPQVMHISGDNFLSKDLAVSESYYFSRYPHVWGWATWRRAWQHYDPEMFEWRNPATQKNMLSQFAQSSERRFWQASWDGVLAGTVKSWAYQWTFSCLLQDGLCVMPAHNLVENIGFRADGTNTLSTDDQLQYQTSALSFPLTHPNQLTRNQAADRYTASLFFERDTTLMRKLRKALSLIKKFRPK